MKTAIACLLAFASVAHGALRGAAPSAVHLDSWPASPVIHTSYGPVSGYRNGSVYYFLGIPFAAPPIGELRFKAPEAPLPWTTVVNVTTPPPKCASGDALAIFDKNSVAGVEDCLYLNVYVPISALPPSAMSPSGTLDLSAAGLPVLQWIYGGGWVTGDSWNDGKYSGAHLATLNRAVVVAGNYRLGPFGFTSLPGLAAETADGSTGNYGLQDQTAAMRWTADNIGAFGGNASSVAIFGQSAGGFSICFHMVSPASAGLFSAAMMESGTCDSPTFFRTRARAYAWSGNYSAGAGCTGSDAEVVSCLRALTPAQLQNVPWEARGGAPDPSVYFPDLYPVMPWGAVIDGAASGLLATPLASMQAGQFNKVPLLLGSNAQDGSVFSILLPVVAPPPGKAFPLPPTAADVKEGIRTLLGAGPHGDASPAQAAALEDVITAATAAGGLYPLTTDGSVANMEATGAMLTQYFFACSARRAASAMAAAGVPAFLYQFSAVVKDDPLYAWFGDYHSLEVGLLFGTQDGDAATAPVTRALGAWWGGMAVGGSPNAATVGGWGNTTLPTWPAYSTATKQHMQITATPTVGADLFGEACDFWDSHYQVAYQPTPLPAQ